jgi:hypothetical protein
MYAQNEKLTILFKRAANLTGRMAPIVAKMDKAKELNPKLKLDTTLLKQAVKDVQIIVGELIGPNAFKEIQGDLKETVKRNDLGTRLKRYSRIITPGLTITRFTERLTVLGIEFSVLLGEFTLLLEKDDPAAEEAMKVETPQSASPDVGAAGIGAATPAQPSQNSPPA